MENKLAQLEKNMLDMQRMDHVMLMGCIHVCRATGEKAWRDMALEQVRAGVPDGAADGMPLLFAMEEDPAEDRRATIEAFAARPLDGLSMVDAYCVLPFRMAYEFRLNRMAWVSRVAAAFRSLHELLYDEKEALHHASVGAEVSAEATGWFLMALVDGIEQCDQQLYEHWRTMVDIFRYVLRGILRVGKAEEIPGMAAYSILKGIRLGIIDPERYRPVGLKLAESLPQGTHPGIEAMVCAEILMMNDAGR